MTLHAQHSTAKKLYDVYADLWPLIRTENIAIVIDSSKWAEGSAGFHLDDPAQMDQYLGSLPPDHPARALATPRYPHHIIVIDAEQALALGGWRDLLQTALHEFAHAIRSELAEGLYPDIHALKKVTHYLESRLGETMGTDEEPPMEIFVTDDLLSDVDRHLFRWDGQGNKPLFGDWVVRTLQHDGAHDLLFYLVLYMLEREATDRGYFEIGGEVVRSVMIPGRLDAILRSGLGPVD